MTGLDWPTTGLRKLRPVNAQVRGGLVNDWPSQVWQLLGQLLFATGLVAYDWPRPA